MALDRWVALVLLGICMAYGYTAWFTMDATLPPIMKRLAVWPSSFSKGSVDCRDCPVPHRPERD